MCENERRFYVYNRTDEVLATPNILTIEQATKVIQAYPLRFKRQGYYLTNARERIAPERVVLALLDVESEEGWELARMAKCF